MFFIWFTIVGPFMFDANAVHAFHLTGFAVFVYLRSTRINVEWFESISGFITCEIQIWWVAGQTNTIKDINNVSAPTTVERMRESYKIQNEWREKKMRRQCRQQHRVLMNILLSWATAWLTSYIRGLCSSLLARCRSFLISYAVCLNLFNFSCTLSLSPSPTFTLSIFLHRLLWPKLHHSEWV